MSGHMSAGKTDRELPLSVLLWKEKADERKD